MQTKFLDERTISCVPEESDDLFALRRIIKEGDRVIGDTTRLIKLEKDFSRPDKGERIKVRIELDVITVSLDNVLDRLRVKGKIVKSSNELIPNGSHHSFTIKLNEAINLYKKNWNNIEKKILKKNKMNLVFLLIAIDTAICGIGRVKGTHLHLLPNIYSGAGGKRYKTSFNIEKFFENIQVAINSTIKNKDVVIMFGPGETKKRFSNYLQNKKIGQNHTIKIIEGIDTGGEDGIYTFTKSSTMKEIMSESKLAMVSKIIDEIMQSAYHKNKKFTMGFIETQKANQFGAINSLIFSEKVIQSEGEDKVIDLLNLVETKGAKVFSVDSSTDIGLRVSGLGGIVSTLRFPIEI